VSVVTPYRLSIFPSSSTAFSRGGGRWTSLEVAGRRWGLLANPLSIACLAQWRGSKHFSYIEIYHNALTPDITSPRFASSVLTVHSHRRR